MANDTAANLISYMSQKLLDVAELNSVLDQFGWKDKSSLVVSSALPTEDSKVSYNFKFKALPVSSEWIRFVRAESGPRTYDSYSTYVFDTTNFEAPEVPALETHALTPEDRAELERLELF